MVLGVEVRAQMQECFYCLALLVVACDVEGGASCSVLRWLDDSRLGRTHIVRGLAVCNIGRPRYASQ